MRLKSCMGYFFFLFLSEQKQKIMNLLNETSREKRLSYGQPNPMASSDTPEQAVPQYLKEYMDFMVNLPMGKPSEEPVDEESTPIPGPYKPKKGLSPELSNSTVQHSIQSIKQLNTTDTNKDYLYKLGLRESSLKPTAKQGSFRGLYQFNNDSLKEVGVQPQDYDNDLNAQHTAALNYKAINLKTLAHYQKYIGGMFKGVHITENGLAAAAHLLGAGTVKDWFDGTTNSERAKKGFVDGLGTNIKEYFELFA